MTTRPSSGYDDGIAHSGNSKRAPRRVSAKSMPMPMATDSIEEPP